MIWFGSEEKEAVRCGWCAPQPRFLLACKAATGRAAAWMDKLLSCFMINQRDSNVCKVPIRGIE
jgi:hypothetical protein